MIVNEGGGGKKLPALTTPGTAADLLSGKQLIDQNGEIVNGTIQTKGSADLTASGRTVTVPAGYYPSQASKSVDTATQATPSITVSSAGLITATASQTAGYVSAGTKNATRQLTTQSGTTITPGTSQKTAVASGRYTTGPVYVAGDPQLTADNIKSGVNIFGVTGTLEGKEIVSFGFLCSGTFGDIRVYTDVSFNEQPDGYEYYLVPEGSQKAWTFECTLGSIIAVYFDRNNDTIPGSNANGFEFLAGAGGLDNDPEVRTFICLSENGTLTVRSR